MPPENVGARSQRFNAAFILSAVHVHSLGVHSGVSQAHALRSVVQKAEGLYHPSKLHKGASDLGGQTDA